MFRTAEEFQVAVLKLCREWDASQTSSFRTTRHNKRVGGHPKSRHLTGFACDVILDLSEDGNATNDTIAVAAFTSAARDVGIKVVEESDHLHLQPLGPEGRP